MQPPRLIISVLLVLCLPLSANAQQEDVRRVITATSPLTKKLGGGKAGDLILNTRVKVQETKGAWSRVTVDGWVRTSSLSPPTVQKQDSSATDEVKLVPAITENVLSVEDYISTHRTDVDPPRQYLMLTIKNMSGAPVSKWQGTLVGQDTKSGEILFREPLSQDKADLQPGKASDVSFYWEPHEQLYSVLGNVKDGSLKLSIVGVSTD